MNTRHSCKIVSLTAKIFFLITGYLKINNNLLEILYFLQGLIKKPKGQHVGKATKLSFKQEKSQKGPPIKINTPKLFKKQLKILHDQIQSNSPSDKFRNRAVRLWMTEGKTWWTTNRYPNLPLTCFYCKIVIRFFLLLNCQFVVLALFFKKFSGCNNGIYYYK